MIEQKSIQHKRDASGRVIQNNMEKKKRKSSIASVGISILVLSVLMLGGLTYLTTSQNNRYSAIVDNQNQHIRMVETELRAKKEIIESTNIKLSQLEQSTAVSQTSEVALETHPEIYPINESPNKPEEIFSTDKE